jgi:hypothetical protein
MALGVTLTFLQSLRAESASILADFMDRLRAFNPPVWRPCSPFGFVTRWFAALPRGSETLGMTCFACWPIVSGVPSPMACRLT